MNISRDSICIRLIILLGMLSPMLVQASCEPSDMPGTWMTYGVNGDTLYEQIPETTRCKIKLNSSGSVVASSSSCKTRGWGGIHNIDVVSGYMEVTSKCVVTGKIRLCISGCVQLVVEHGALSTDKAVLSILGYLKHDPDLVFSYTGIKR